MNRQPGIDVLSADHRSGGGPWALALSSVVALAGVACPASGGAGTHLMVMATVRPVATLELQSTPPPLQLSAADLVRGYVDVRRPMQLRIYSNSRRGYELIVLPVSSLFSSVDVGGLGSQVSLGPDGGVIVQRWQRPQAVSLALTYHFVLEPGLAAGRYSWPLQLHVQALTADP